MYDTKGVTIFLQKNNFDEVTSYDVATYYKKVVGARGDVTCLVEVGVHHFDGHVAIGVSTIEYELLTFEEFKYSIEEFLSYKDKLPAEVTNCIFESML